MSENLKHIIPLIFVLALAGTFYYLSTNDTFFKNHQQRAQIVEQETIKLKREIIDPLKRLSDVSIDRSIFDSKVLNSLEDMNVPLDPPDLARPNPFEAF